MKKQDLEQLRSLRKEIEIIQMELDNLPVVTDKVTGSMDQFPYLPRSITIEGRDEQKGRQLRRRLEIKVDNLQDKLIEIEEWMDSVEDVEMRSLLRLRYQNGFSWEETAANMGYGHTYDTARKRVERFFKKI